MEITNIKKIEPRKRKPVRLIRLLKKELEMTDEKIWEIMNACTTDERLDVDKFVRSVEEAYKLKGLTA